MHAAVATRLLQALPLKLLTLGALLIAAIPVAMTTTLAAADATPSVKTELPEPTATKLPYWRGFNLLECFTLGGYKPFEENDFRMISELGFNFVRLPLDYRIWIKDGDWTRLDEDRLKEIDKAVEYGKKYNVHVNINFHRAPGYTVNHNPRETADLWTDPEAQRICAMHWAEFARRYKGIPNRNVSFNLFNEPDSHVTEEKYAAVVRKMTEAIRRIDPDRLIIVDGLEWGNDPAPSLADLGVAQATRGYVPFTISHYYASWVKDSDKCPVPTWPEEIAPELLHGPERKELTAPLTLNGPFPTECVLRMHIIQVSILGDLRVLADGKEVFAHRMKPGEGEGEWKKAMFSKEYKVWQNDYDLDLKATIPAGTRSVQIVLHEGDWLRMSEIGIRPAAGDQAEQVLKLRSMNTFFTKPEWYNISYNAGATPPAATFSGGRQFNRETLWTTRLLPWIKLEKEKKVGVMVGEFGSFNKTPHPVTLHWLEDVLKNYKQAGFGWALWNFRGSFGVMDSGRTDVKYEDFQGHKLDRKMLELLQRY